MLFEKSLPRLLDPKGLLQILQVAIAISEKAGLMSMDQLRQGKAFEYEFIMERGAFDCCCTKVKA